MIKNIIKKIHRPIEIFLVAFAIVHFSAVHISFSTLTESEIKSKYEFFKPVIEKLIENNVDTTFIYTLLADSRTRFNEKYVKINVSGFLKRTDYSQHYNKKAVRKSLEFLQDYGVILDKCEIEFDIPKEIITSIIWIETKHGDYLGNNHIPSVFLSTALANKAEYIEMNKQRLYSSFEGDSEKLKSLEEKLIQRAEKKTNWAINELKSLEKIYNAGQIDILGLRGSWAGAFGLSQFLPSSYSQWAIDGNGDGKIDLFDVGDAIYSTANYLKINGWGNEVESKRKALFHYNNSNDYVDAVLTLAKKVKLLYALSMPLDKQVKGN